MIAPSPGWSGSPRDPMQLRIAALLLLACLAGLLLRATNLDNVFPPDGVLPSDGVDPSRGRRLVLSRPPGPVHLREFPGDPRVRSLPRVSTRCRPALTAPARLADRGDRPPLRERPPDVRTRGRLDFTRTQCAPPVERILDRGFPGRRSNRARRELASGRAPGWRADHLSRELRSPRHGRPAGVVLDCRVAARAADLGDAAFRARPASCDDRHGAGAHLERKSAVRGDRRRSATRHDRALPAPARTLLRDGGERPPRGCGRQLVAAAIRSTTGRAPHEPDPFVATPHRPPLARCPRGGPRCPRTLLARRAPHDPAGACSADRVLPGPPLARSCQKSAMPSQRGSVSSARTTRGLRTNRSRCPSSTAPRGRRCQRDDPLRVSGLRHSADSSARRASGISSPQGIEGPVAPGLPLDALALRSVRQLRSATRRISRCWRQSDSRCC